MKYFKYFVMLICLGIDPSSAYAAKISVKEINSTVCKKNYDVDMCMTLLISGEIQPGDTLVFRDRIKKLLSDSSKVGLDISKMRIGAVALSSNGGDVKEAMKLGREIRKLEAGTHIYPEDVCHSACVIAFLGGVFRTPMGEVGIHSFYSKSWNGTYDLGAGSVSYNAAKEEIVNYLNELRIPLALMDEMQKVPHTNLAVLSWDAKKRLGVFGIDPVYAATHDKISKGTKYTLD